MPTDKGCPCVYVMHIVMYCMWWPNRTDKGEERDSVSPFFFFDFVDLGSRALCRDGRAKRDGWGWDGMTCDYDTRANYLYNQRNLKG
jgi:hypothetical protein